MPGSGKSTLGKGLAKRLKLPFVDLDLEVETRAGLSVQQIFAQQGEESFRILESETLNDWINSTEGFVMATGGGAPCFHGGMERINRSGLSVFLEVPLSVLAARTANATDRPLLMDADRLGKLTELYHRRLNIYRMAHLIHDNENGNLEELTERILRRSSQA